MGQGREPRPGGGRRTHEALVARIVAAPPGHTHEERARTVVDAVAELFERDASLARSALLDLATDDDAQRKLAAWIECRVDWTLGLFGAIANILQRGPASPKQRDHLVTALLLWLED
jgi:hypothetical protein